MLNIETIKAIAAKNFALPENQRYTIAVDGCAMANPWMDKTGRFELTDADAVKEWGLSAVLQFCEAAGQIGAWALAREQTPAQEQKTPEENTLVHYMYRDASNYKIGIDVILHGRLSEDQMKAFNVRHAENTFYPSKLGLPNTTFVDQGYSSYDDDPDWHEFCWLEYSDAPATEGELTIEDFVAKFPSVKTDF